MALRKRLLGLALRVAAVVLVAGVVIALPDVATVDADSILRYKNAIVVLIGIVLTGKFLYDTFFFERLRM
jgi:hypothetical protein